MSSLSFTLDALATQLVTPEEVGLDLSDSDLASLRHAGQRRRERELTELTRSGFRLPALHRRPTSELTTSGPQQTSAAQRPALHLEHGDSGTPPSPSSPEDEIRHQLTEIMIASQSLEDDVKFGCDNMTDQRIINLLHLVNTIFAALEKIEEPAKNISGKIDATLAAQIAQYAGAAQRQITHALMHLSSDYELAADLTQEEDLAKLVLTMDHHLETLKTHEGIRLRNWYVVLQMIFLHPLLEKLSYSRRPVSVSKPAWLTYQNLLGVSIQFKKALMAAHQEGTDGEHTNLEPDLYFPLVTDLGQALMDMTDVLKALSGSPTTPESARDKTDIFLTLRFLFTQNLQHDIPHFLSHFHQEFSSTEEENIEPWLKAVSRVHEGLIFLGASGLFDGTDQEEQLELWCAKITNDLVQPVYLRLLSMQNGSYLRSDAIGEA